MNKKFVGPVMFFSLVAHNILAMGEEVGRRRSHEEKVSAPIVRTTRPIEPTSLISRAGYPYKPVVYHTGQRRIFTPPLLPLPSTAESGQVVAQRQVPPRVPPKPSNKRLSVEEQYAQPSGAPQPLPPWVFPEQVTSTLSLPAPQARTQEEARMETEAKRAREIKQLQEKTAQINRELIEKNLPAEQAAFAGKETARSLEQRAKLYRKVYGK